jgi:Na+(H+)/acetate symporter ActP
MLFIAYTIGLIFSLVLVYMAGKKGIYWLQIVLVLALVVVTTTSALIVGMEMGKSSSESQFYSMSKRTLGKAFCQMSEEGNRGDVEVLLEKVNHLCAHWNKTKFFEEDGGESFRELYWGLADIVRVVNEVQPGEVVNASDAAGNPESHLHD